MSVTTYTAARCVRKMINLTDRSTPNGAPNRLMFVDRLVAAAYGRPPCGGYFGSIEIEPENVNAAESIAWLRREAYMCSEEPVEINDFVGALGEWAVLRLINRDPRVVPASIVSYAPVAAPDFVVTEAPSIFSFDVKTSRAFSSRPGFEYCPKDHVKKGNPHILGVHLVLPCAANDSNVRKVKIADLYFVGASTLSACPEYQNEKLSRHFF